MGRDARLFGLLSSHPPLLLARGCPLLVLGVAPLDPLDSLGQYY